MTTEQTLMNRGRQLPTYVTQVLPKLPKTKHTWILSIGLKHVIMTTLDNGDSDLPP